MKQKKAHLYSAIASNVLAGSCVLANKTAELVDPSFAQTNPLFEAGIDFGIYALVNNSSFFLFHTAMSKKNKKSEILLSKSTFYLTNYSALAYASISTALDQVLPYQEVANSLLSSILVTSSFPLMSTKIYSSGEKRIEKIQNRYKSNSENLEKIMYESFSNRIGY